MKSRWTLKLTGQDVYTLQLLPGRRTKPDYVG